MSRPLHRGLSGGGTVRPGSGGGGREPFDQINQAKYFFLEKNHHQTAKDYYSNGFNHDISSLPGVAKVRQQLIVTLLKLGISVIIVLALFGSLYRSMSLSAVSQVGIHRSYRRMQEQVVTDLALIGELSSGTTNRKELEFCPPEYENYVPCYYNISENVDSESLDVLEYERKCARSSANEGCLILPPCNYRIPLRWSTGKDFIWKDNVKISGHEFSSGSLTKRMMVEEEHISFRSDSLMVDGVEDYSHQIAEMIGLRNESNFNEAGDIESLCAELKPAGCTFFSADVRPNERIMIRTVLDIGCGFGTFGAHLSSKELLTLCIANYEASGSQVQLTLERGIPAMIGSFSTKQLPFPFLSFDMLHCARCGIDWEKNNGIFLAEVDRLLKPGGYFVWTSLMNTHRALRDKDNQKKWNLIRDFAENLCWDMLSQQDETVLWKKTSKKKCYYSRKSGPDVCGKSRDIESPYYHPLNPCIAGTRSKRWIPIEDRTPWPSRVRLNSTELGIYGVPSEDFSEDASNWNTAVRNYWSLLSPLIFSDHPKRPGDEDPCPPFNMVRNVLDMNAQFGGFNAALLESEKSVWVMNVVPAHGPNYLPLILDRGFIGVQHDWCEAFPTYPRTYDMVHAGGLLSLQSHQKGGCSMLEIFVEVDRILRPEGWVILRDAAPLIEEARSVITQLKWDARMMELDSNSDEKLLICQKLFFRKQQN